MVLFSFSIPEMIDLIKTGKKAQTTRIPRKIRSNGNPAYSVGDKVQLYYRSRMKGNCNNCLDTLCRDEWAKSKPVRCEKHNNFFGESEILDIIHYYDGDYKERHHEIWTGYTLTHADDEDAEAWAVADGFKDYGSAYDYFYKSTGNPHWADQNLDVIVWSKDSIIARWKKNATHND